MIEPRPKTVLEQDRAITARTGISIETPPWMADAACRGTKDPDLFYPHDPNATGRAAQICAGCPVRAACLDYALETRQAFGVWGGESAYSRARTLRARRDVA